MKKNNLYGTGITLNLFQLILCVGIIGVRMLDVLGDFYVRISVFALEIIMWITISMYLFIKHDFTGAKTSFKAAFTAIMPVMLLTGAAALMGYFGDTTGADWLGFAFLGSSVSFYNKPAVILTEYIPIADGYVMFFINYAILFVSSFIGGLMGSAMNKKIRKSKDTAEETVNHGQDMSVTQILEKIDEEEKEAVREITDTADEELSETVLDEAVEKADEDTTTAVISIDDDDDDSEIISQETVEIISLDVDELEDEAESQLKSRYDDIQPAEAEETAEVAEEITEEVTAYEDDVEDDEIIFEEDFDIELSDDEDYEIADQLFDEDIFGDESGSFEEIMSFVEENVTEENGWTFLSEDESDELLRLAKELPAEDFAEETEDEDEYEENETISFDEMIEIIMQEDADDIAEEDTEETDGITVEETEEVITPEVCDTYEEISAESVEEPEEPAEDITEEIPVITAAEEIIEDFSDITFEDIEILSDEEIDEDDYDDYEEIPVIIPEETADEEFIDLDDEIVVDFDVDEILADTKVEENSGDENGEEDINEEEVKAFIRGEEITGEITPGIPAEEPAEEVTTPEDTAEAEVTEEKDELSVIADYVRAFTDKEVEVVKVITEEPEKPKVKVVTQKDIKKQRDKEFDNWLNRKTARLDVKAIREALKESEEE